MKKIFISSPYGGEWINQKCAIDACKFVAAQGHIPIAPHTFIPQYLDESSPEERELGVQMGVALLHECDEMWILGELVTDGMWKELGAAFSMAESHAHYGTREFTVKRMKWSDVGVEHWTESNSSSER